MRNLLFVVVTILLFETTTLLDSTSVLSIVGVADAAELSQDEAAEQARKQTGGRVLSVEAQTKDERDVYLVKVLLENGTVRIVEIDKN